MSKRKRNRTATDQLIAEPFPPLQSYGWLPIDMWESITAQLMFREVLKLRRVCRHMNSLTTQVLARKKLVRMHFPQGYHDHRYSSSSSPSKGMPPVEFISAITVAGMSPYFRMLPTAFRRYDGVKEFVIRAFTAQMRQVFRRAIRFLPQSLESICVTSRNEQGMTKEDFMLMLPHLPLSLIKLSISNNTLGPAATVKRLAHLTNLTYIDLSGMWQKVAPESIEGLKEAIPAIPHLKTIILGNTFGTPTMKKIEGFPQIQCYD